MQCRTHPERAGVNTCNQCGEWLCEECTIEINGRIFCRRCLAQLAKEPGTPAPAPAAARPARMYAAAPGRHISWGLLFFFSCIIPVPGLNYMYEGLIKRGLAAMSTFFLLIYLTATFQMWPFSLIFGLSFPVFILTSIFDGFAIRRRINAGETVNDDIDDIIVFVQRNKRLIFSFIGLIIILSLFSAVFSIFGGPIRALLPIIVVAFGLCVLFKKPGSAGARRKPAPPIIRADIPAEDGRSNE
jgi:hypothetical protein